MARSVYLTAHVDGEAVGDGGKDHAGADQDSFHLLSPGNYGDDIVNTGQRKKRTNLLRKRRRTGTSP